MPSRNIRALVVSACTLAVATPAPAQTHGTQPAIQNARIAPGQWALDGTIGFAVPVGDFGTGVETGLDLMGAVEYRPAATGPVYFRGEIGYSDFGFCGCAPNGPSSLEISSTAWRFAANGLYDFNTHSALHV